MQFEKFVGELVLTSSPSATGPIWAASLPASCFPHAVASSRPTHLPRSRALMLSLWPELLWWPAPALPENTLLAHPDPWGWAATAVSPQLAFHKTRDWGAMAFEHPAALPGMLVVPGELCSGEQRHHSSIMGHKSLFFSSFLTLPRSLEAHLLSALPLPLSSPSPVFASSPSLVSSQPLSCPPPWVYLLPLSSLQTGEPPTSPIKPDTLGGSCLLSATCSWFYLPPEDGFHKAAVSAEVRRLPALALTCIPALKIMDTIENRWRICNFIPFIASYCITPWPSDT